MPNRGPTVAARQRLQLIALCCTVQSCCLLLFLYFFPSGSNAERGLPRTAVYFPSAQARGGSAYLLQIQTNTHTPFSLSLYSIRLQARIRIFFWCKGLHHAYYLVLSAYGCDDIKQQEQKKNVRKNGRWHLTSDRLWSSCHSFSSHVFMFKHPQQTNKKKQSIESVETRMDTATLTQTERRHKRGRKTSVLTYHHLKKKIYIYIIVVKQKNQKKKQPYQI